MTKVNTPDGQVFNFPDGTPPEVMKQAIDRHYAKTRTAPEAAPLKDTAPKVEPTALVKQEAGVAPEDSVRPGSGINPVSGALDAALQGATFGFSDEAIAGTRAALESGVNLVRGQPAALSQNYDKALAYERQRLKDFETEHPVVSAGANLAGGLAGVTPGIGLVRGAASLPGQVARSAGLGVASGALGGFGAGEEGLENRAQSALAGGVVGGAVGAALPAAGMAIGKGAELARNVVGANKPRDVALSALERGLTRDVVAPQETIARLDAASPDKPMGLMDVGGDNLLRQARLAETTPGPGSNVMKNFLNERQAGEVDRVSAEIESKIAKGDNFKLGLEELDKARKAKAAPLYQKAYAKPFVWDDEIGNLLNRPGPKEAMKRAYKIAAEEGEDPRGLGLDFDADGNVDIVKTKASMKTLDYVKRGLSDVVEDYRNDYGKLELDTHGRAINNTLNKFVDKLDKLNPDYAKARQEWGGPTQTMEAMHKGRRFALGDPEDVISSFKKMSPDDKDAFRIGVARQLSGDVQGTRGLSDPIKKFFDSKGQRNRLRQIFDSDDEYKAFEKSMFEEQALTKHRNEVLMNSKTLRNSVDLKDAEGLAGQAVVDFASGGLTGAALGFARRAVSRTTVGMGEKSAKELAEMLTTTDRDTQRKIIDELLARQAKAQASGARSAAIRTIPALGAANLTGQGMARSRNEANR